MPHKQKKIAELNPLILRQIDRANNIDWNNVVPLVIDYGRKPAVSATGVVIAEFAQELTEAGLLKQTDNGVYMLDIPKRHLTKDDVDAHIKRIETYCVRHGHIKGLRGERLHLTDSLNPADKGHYASYDRNLDVLGFVVHSVCVITHQCTGKEKGALVLAKRHPTIIAAKGDSNWDVLSGAIAYGDTPFATMISEGYDEYGLSIQQMRRAKAVTTITTHRTRENPYSIVREMMQVSTLGLTENEVAKLQCHDIKEVSITDDKGASSKVAVHSNIGFIKIGVKKLLRRLRNRKYLKNGKALAVMGHLLHAGHIAANDPYAEDVRQGLARKPKAYCRIKRTWTAHPRCPVRGSVRGMQPLQYGL